jgi:hypothetical protein
LKSVGGRMEPWSLIFTSAITATSLSVKAGPSPSWVNKSPQSKGSACLFVENAGVPAVGNMRRVDVADPLAFTQVDDFTVMQDLRRTVCHVVQ